MISEASRPTYWGGSWGAAGPPGNNKQQLRVVANFVIHLYFGYMASTGSLFRFLLLFA